MVILNWIHLKAYEFGRNEHYRKMREHDSNPGVIAERNALFAQPDNVIWALVQQNLYDQIVKTEADIKQLTVHLESLIFQRQEVQRELNQM